MDDSLAAGDIQPRLRGRFGRDVYVHASEVASTQELLSPGDPEGAVAVAEHQSAGRGRLGRTWEDAPSTSLLVSIALRPNVPDERLPELTVVAAEACAAAIRVVAGVSAGVKHPNDVLVLGRKVAGVLGEASDGFVRLGVGVNVNQESGQLPSDVRLDASSLRIEAGRHVDRADLLVELLAQVEQRYDEWLGKR